MAQIMIRGDAATLKAAADALAGRRLKAGVRAFALPESSEQYADAIDNGAIKALVAAGVVICAPGTPEPAIAPGETAVASIKDALY